MDVCERCGVVLLTLENANALRDSRGLTPLWMPNEGCVCTVACPRQCSDQCRVCVDRLMVCQRCGERMDAGLLFGDEPEAVKQGDET